jgi:hypothetical protein
MPANAFNFNIYNTLILLGILQGVFFVLAVLFSKKYNKAASTRFLAAIILSFSANNLSYYLKDINAITVSEFYIYLYYPLVLLLPPLFYFEFLGHFFKG